MYIMQFAGIEESESFPQVFHLPVQECLDLVVVHVEHVVAVS